MDTPNNNGVWSYTHNKPNKLSTYYKCDTGEICQTKTQSVGKKSFALQMPNSPNKQVQDIYIFLSNHTWETI